MPRTNYDYIRQANGWTRENPLKLDTTGKYTSAHVYIMFDTVGENPYDVFDGGLPGDGYGVSQAYIHQRISMTTPETGEIYIKPVQNIPAYNGRASWGENTPETANISDMPCADFTVGLDAPEVYIFTSFTPRAETNGPTNLQVSAWIIYT